MSAQISPVIGFVPDHYTVGMLITNGRWTFEVVAFEDGVVTLDDGQDYFTMTVARARESRLAFVGWSS